MKKQTFSELLSHSYYLPWSAEDNPNGWIEPTTFCQLKCPGCYRGLDQDGRVRIHEELEEMKKQVDRFAHERNVQTISIAGGEPLLYPGLRDLLRYIRAKNLKTKIFTNGVALNETVLVDLKNSGADEFIIHIDKNQTRPDARGYRSESEMNRLRESFCNLFRRVDGVNLGFIQPISRRSVSDVSTILQFCRFNADVVSLVVFTLYSDIAWTEQTRASIDTDLSVDDIVAEIRKDFSYRPSAYLGSTEDKSDPTWLFSISVGFKDRVLGFFDGKLYRAIQERYHSRTGKYLYTKVGNKISFRQLLGLSGYSSVREIIRKYLQSAFRVVGLHRSDLYLQTLLILRGPKVNERGERDLCDGCPDAMFYRGILVPSCILEEIKRGVHPKALAS